MLSNLNSCHGVFIPTSLQHHYGGYGNSSVGGGNTRHYRSHQSTTCIKNDTKKNKRLKEEVNIWATIEEDFMPDILHEYSNIDDEGLMPLHLPETIKQSPKQTSLRGDGGDGGGHGDGVSEILAGSSQQPYVKRISALFIKPETDVECLYRKSGVRENCEVCSSDVVLTDDGFLTCKSPACSILYKDESHDQSAEWRYYGADDNQNNDPTRCGMQVNPLLKES